MILLDKPYVSEYFKTILLDSGFPVVATKSAEQFNLSTETNWISEEKSVASFRQNGFQKLYSNSENALDWIDSNLSFTQLPAQIQTLKNKVTFRDGLREFYPEYKYEAVALNNLRDFIPSAVPYPFIIKPAIGFFSLGVHMVNCAEEWGAVVDTIFEELEDIKSQYPVAVLDTNLFIIEECIEGEEYAIDAYYDEQGEPVILNILKHPFSSAADVSDRAYYTRIDFFMELLEPFQELLKKIGNPGTLKNFPVHLEARIDDNGLIQPIEANPMRFAGWCVTDLAWYAYGITPYRCYFDGKRPDWNKLVKEHKGKVYAMMIFDLPADVKPEQVASFDWDKALALFPKVLDLRKIDYYEYPIFGFLFAELDASDLSAMETVLRADMRDYICFK
ncbi:MAG: ATP-grasp domain-containing protein [Desulfuromonadales bacterium]|nr:ATP-grasp domain-containing protein [Desulfuromonadales bacterium]